LGTVGSLAAGALIGILFALDKGSVTSKKVMEKSDKYTAELNHKFNDVVENISQKSEETVCKHKE